MIRQAIIVVAAALITGLVPCARAQNPVAPAARCDRVDTTASWYRRQAEWWALDQRHDWSNDSLRTQLLRVAEILDVTHNQPFPIQLGAEKTGEDVIAKVPADRLRDELPPVRQMLRDMAQGRSWPLRSSVGPAGVRAAWVIANGDSALTSTAMPRMMEAGPGEVSAPDVAVLEDWLRIRTGRKQIYGSQLQRVTVAGRTKLEPEPTEDLRHVDLRRDEAGLPPLPFALCTAERWGHM